MAVLQLYLRLRYQSKMLLAQLEISALSKIGIPIGLNLKLSNHRWEISIKINMEVENITKFY